MTNKHKVRALVPVKNFSDAKTRLRDVLQAGECAELASGMAWDVASAIRSSASVHGLTLLGNGDAIEALARELGCEHMAESGDAGLSANLDIAARRLEADGVETLIVIPADLPTLTADDVDDLVSQSVSGLNVCPAGRDGGTNALVVTPPTAIPFQYSDGGSDRRGHRSAWRHVEAGRAAGLATREIDSAAFGVDIDTPADLAWLCEQPLSGRTAEILDRAGLRTKILERREALSA